MAFKLSTQTKELPIVSQPRAIPITEESFSSRLVNIVESVRIDGVDYTKFYTEVDTNMKVGDKIFIVNGNYDTYDIIRKNPYRMGADGYEILQIDRTGIVLDIEYTGDSVWEEDDFDNYIKLWRAGDDGFNSPGFISPATNGQMSIKYEEFQSAYKPFKYTYGYEGNNNIMHATLGALEADTFRVYDAIAGSWIDITSGFESNSLPTLSGETFTSNNGKVLVVGESFTHNDQKFEKNQVYKYEGTEWVKDSLSSPAFLSKSLFRKGDFNGGTFNDGIFGSFDNVEDWTGANWRNGIFYHSNWKNGKMQSKSDSLPRQSYYSQLEDGIVKETTDFANNFGFGYNLVIDSTFETATIINSNIENSVLGLTSAIGTQSALRSYHNDNIDNFQSVLDIEKARITKSDVENVKLGNGTFEYANIRNAIIEDGISIDSNMDESAFVGGRIEGNTIDILNYQRIILSEDYEYENPYATASFATSSTSLIVSHKFFISKDDFLKIERGDYLYFNNLITSTPIMSGIFDAEFYIGGNDLSFLTADAGEFYNGEIDNNDGLITNEYYFTVHLKNATQNNGLSTVSLTDGFPTLNTVSDIELPSVDLVVKYTRATFSYTNEVLSEYLDSEYGVSVSDFQNATIQKSKFKKSIADNVTWEASKFDDLDLVIHRTGGGDAELDITLGGTPSNYYLDVELGRNLTSVVRNRQDTNIWYDDKMSVGDILYMDKIQYTEGTYSFNLNGKYLVSTYSVGSPRTVRLEDYPGDNVLNNGFTYSGSGTFIEFVGEPTFTSLHSEMILNSDISYGVFKRALLESSEIFDEDFVIDTDTFINSELDIPTLNSLKFMNMLICGLSDLTVKSGIFYQSFIDNNDWELGIIFKSAVDKIDFSNGVIKESFFNNSNFSNGVFIDSNDSIISDLTIAGDDWSTNSYNSRWSSGTFSNGIMFNSHFWNGDFESGKFYNGRFNRGNFNGGEFGDVRYNNSDTQFAGVGFAPVWNNGVFTNGLFGPESSTVIHWYNGTFNGGVMDGTGLFNLPGTTWHKGIFNNGEIINDVRWDSGVFNNGKFNSQWGTGYGTESNNYSWVDGTFNNGEFGVGTASTTSPKWKGGVFKGGEFRGHIWNSGVFTGGKFIGGTTHSASANPDAFSIDFQSTVGGFWRNGIVKQNLREIRALSFVESSIDSIKRFKGDPEPAIEFSNMLWANGTFSSGVMENSVWWSGEHRSGRFEKSNFNPYVRRWDTPEIELYKPDYIGNPGTAVYHYDLGSQSCIWYNGFLENSRFQISEWKSGTVNIGTFSSADWERGLVLYADMDNCIWRNGRWRNGNWQGSPFNISDLGTNVVGPTATGELSFIAEKDELTHQLLRLGTNEAHTWGLIERPDYRVTVNNTGTWVFGRTSLQLQVYAGPDNASAVLWDTLSGAGAHQVGSGIGGSSVASGDIPGGWYFRVEPVIPGGPTMSQWDDTSYSQITAVAVSNGVPFGTAQQLGRANAHDYTKPPGAPTVDRYRAFDQNTFLNSSLDFPELMNLEGQERYKDENNKKVTLASSIADTLTYSSVKNAIGYSETLNFPGASYSHPDHEIKKVIFEEDFVNNNNGWSFVQTSGTTTLPSTTFAITGGQMRISYGAWVSGIGNFAHEAFLQNILEVGKEYEVEVTVWSRYGERATEKGPNGSAFPRVAIGIGTEQGGGNFTGPFAGITTLHHRRFADTTDLRFRFDHINSSVFAPVPTHIWLDNVVVREIVGETKGKIGTGKFIEGIWENGVWNSGERRDETYELFDDVDLFFQLGRNSWRVTINGATANGPASSFNIGDDISVGNIVALDINGNRKLLKDSYKVVSVDEDEETISFNVDINFPIRNIAKDSDNHVIQVTKNNWKSGLFLNGIFEGVWNNGYFKGYPCITQMTHSHWIDGTFDGGDFNSRMNSIIEPGNISAPYSTGVIQKMRFLEGDDGSNYVNSILDVNFIGITESNERTSLIIGNDLGLQLGYQTTNDVLESISTFNYGPGDPTPDITYTLNLGTKFKEFDNLVTDDLLEVIPPERLEDRGWSFSMKGGYSEFPPAAPGFEPQDIFLGNDGTEPYNAMRIDHPGGGAGFINSDKAVVGFDNVTDNFLKRRYYRQTFSINTWTIPANTPPAGYVDFHPSLAPLGDTFITYDKWNSGITTYTKYTWNWQGTNTGKFFLETYLWNGDISGIEFVELDMVPMHRYWYKDIDVEANPFIKDRNCSIQLPFFATAPFIDYADSDFSFIDNVAFEFNEGNVGSNSGDGGVGQYGEDSQVGT